jgi:hypothetical protein
MRALTDTPGLTNHTGFAEYGCTFNPQKTQVNFVLPQEGARTVPPGAGFPWCGLLLSERLCVRSDYGRLAGTRTPARCMGTAIRPADGDRTSDVSDGLTIDGSYKPGELLKHRLF